MVGPISYSFRHLWNYNVHTHTIICSLGEEPVEITKEASRDDEVLRKHASKKQEFTQIIKRSLKAIWSKKGKRLMF